MGMSKKYIGKIIRCKNDGLIFRSSSEAARYYGITQSCINAVYHGRLLKTCGLSFEFVQPTRDIILSLREEE